METLLRVSSHSVLKLDSLFATASDPFSVRLPITMTPLAKSNLRILLILIAGALMMTGFWIYFIIAKEPIRP